MTTVAQIDEAIEHFKGCWSKRTPTPGDPKWWASQHTLTGNFALIRVIDNGAAIIQADDGGFDWTGHDLKKGFREVDEYLRQHNRS